MRDKAFLAFEVRDLVGPSPTEERQLYFQPASNRLRILSDPIEAKVDGFYVSN